MMIITGTIANEPTKVKISYSFLLESSNPFNGDKPILPKLF